MEQTKKLSNKNKMLILFSVVMMTFMNCLDGSIVNVTLPTMAKKMSVSTEMVSWVVTVYLITISATILIFGRLGDMKGKVKIFQTGVILFTFGSLLCGLANSFLILILARIIQAIGAAGAMSTNQGIITQVFPKNERGKALGLLGTSVALGTLLGPPLGGFIISILSWEYIFLVNVPIGIFTFIIGIIILPKSNPDKFEKLDSKGAFLFTSTILLLFGAIIIGEDIGYKNPFIIFSFIIALLAFISFIFIERKLETPLLQLKIFENKLFSLSIFCGFISFVAINCSNIILPFYLQNAMKFSPATTGFIMMAYPLILAIVAPVSGHLSDKIGSEFLTFLGLVITSLGLFLMSTLNEHSQLMTIITFIIIMSLGNGMFQAPNNSLIMSTVPSNRLGIAGSINSLVRNLGLIVGITLSTNLLYNRMSSKLGYPVLDYVLGRDDVFIYGMKCVYIIAGIICMVGALLTAWRLYGNRKGSGIMIEE